MKISWLEVKAGPVRLVLPNYATSRSGPAGGVVGQHQGEHHDDRQRRQARRHALHPETLFVVAAPACQQAQADDAVEDDHDRGEYGVPGEGAGGLAAGEHHRDDQRDLDDRHRQREDQRAERFAYPVGDDLGVVDGRDDAATQADDKQRHEAGRRWHQPGQDEHEHARERHRHCPGRVVIYCACCHPGYRCARRDTTHRSGRKQRWFQAISSPCGWRAC